VGVKSNTKVSYMRPDEVYFPGHASAGLKKKAQKKKICTRS
jgi:hypothetical protein